MLGQRYRSSRRPAASRARVSTSPWVTVGSVQVQLFPGQVTAGQATTFGPLDSRDVAVANGAQPAYFADARDGDRRRG